MYIYVSVCDQLTMLLIVLFSESFFEEKNRGKHIYLPDLSCIGIFALNQEQLKNCFIPTKTGEAFAHLDEGDAILN